MTSNQEPLRLNAGRLNADRPDRSSAKRLALIRERVNSLASRFSGREKTRPSNDKAEDLEYRIRTPPKKHEPPEHCVEDTDEYACVDEFLKALGLEDLSAAFTEHQVSLSDLASLTRQDLIEMRIPLGPRNRILKEAQKLEVSGSIYNRELSTEASSFQRPSSELSMSDGGSHASHESIELMLKRMAQQQSLMMRAIEETRRTLDMLTSV